MAHIDTNISRRQRVKKLMILACQDGNNFKKWQAQHLIDRIDSQIVNHVNAKQIFKAA